MSERANRLSRRTKCIITTVSVVFILYVILVNVLVSAALVPSFMRRLDKFQQITDKSISEQVHTQDIEVNSDSQLSETDAWLADCEAIKYSMKNADGYNLIGMCFPADAETHSWAVLLHGYTGCKEEMYRYAYWYHKRGFNVLVPDLRAQGESEGRYIGMGYTDAADVLEWIDRAVLKTDPEAKIVLQGQSMGAACALMMSGMTELPANVAAVVSDCAYTDAYSMFRYKIKDWFGLPAFPIVDSAAIALRLRGGYDLRMASALDAVRGDRLPTLIIHGNEDKLIPVSMAYELFNACAAEQKELLIIRGAGHAQAADKDPDAFYGAIGDLLDSVF